MDTILDTSAVRTRAVLGPRTVLIDLASIALAIVGSSLAIWGIAAASPSIHRGFLFLLVIVPNVVVLSSLLRRHCYPNTPVWRSGSISPFDPIPAPLGRKLYVALLTGAGAGVALLLAFVILSRSWNAGNLGQPQTSFSYDVFHPWSLPPLTELPAGVPQDQAAAARPIPVPWWMFPGVGLLFPLIVLGWCGTLERTTLRARLPVTHQRQLQPDIAWDRILAAFALLLVWLPLFGLVFAALAYLANRRGAGWTLRVSQICLALSALLHATLGVVCLVEMR